MTSMTEVNQQLKDALALVKQLQRMKKEVVKQAIVLKPKEIRRIEYSLRRTGQCVVSISHKTGRICIWTSVQKYQNTQKSMRRNRIPHKGEHIGHNLRQQGAEAAWVCGI